MNANGSISIAALMAATRAWVEEPFNSKMDLLGWFLIVGVILISGFLWSLILNSFRE